MENLVSPENKTAENWMMVTMIMVALKGVIVGVQSGALVYANRRQIAASPLLTACTPARMVPKIPDSRAT